MTDLERENLQLRQRLDQAEAETEDISSLRKDVEDLGTIAQELHEVNEKYIALLKESTADLKKYNRLLRLEKRIIIAGRAAIDSVRNGYGHMTSALLALEDLLRESP